MSKNYWLMKTEPNVFSIDDLANEPEQTAHWDGVRNYKARNYMRDAMKVGDSVLFYHSNINPSVAGVARIVEEGYPDHTSWDPASKYFDEKSTEENPRWFMVDIQFEKKFKNPITLSELRDVSGLENMVLLRKGMRLSVQPVTEDEFSVIMSLADKQ